MTTYVPSKIPVFPDIAIRVDASDKRALPYPSRWVAVVGDGSPSGTFYCYGASAEEAIAKLKARMRQDIPR